MRKVILLLLCIACNAVFGQYDKHSQWIIDENQPVADLGNGYFKNPIIAGNLADPSLIRVKEDYYMIHGKGVNHAFILWHSKDLVNWKAVKKIPTGLNASPWAPDLVQVNGKYYIYVTATTYREDGTRSFANYVYHADNILGEWSAPVNLQIKGLIDPGHLLAEDGKRYLFFEKGAVVELTKDGLSVIGEVQRDIYDGWDYPSEWAVECRCLEAPKLFYRHGYYYLISAMGGTHLPPTSHMAVVERSKNPLGPYKDAPNSPLIHTYYDSEGWWAQGHATLIEHTDGSWWAMYHGIENGHTDMGRQTLLLPVEWREDGWPVVKNHIKADAMIKKPTGENIGHGYKISDDFTSDVLGIQWNVSKNDLENIEVGNGKMTLKAKGTSYARAMKVSTRHINHNFEVSVELEIESNTVGGITLGGYGAGLKDGAPAFFNNEPYNAEAFKYSPVMFKGSRVQNVRNYELEGWPDKHIHIKIRNENNTIVMHYSVDGINWKPFARSFYTHSVTPHLFAYGEGKVVFKNFTYRGLD